MFSFEYFIAKREVSRNRYKKSISGSIVNIVIFGISLCVAVMIIAISILTGFKQEIRNKVIGFGSHIQILNFDSNNSFETKPIDSRQQFKQHVSGMPGIRHIQRFATKPGIAKAGMEFEGAVLKVFGPEYDWNFFKNSLLEGDVVHPTDTGRTKDVMISKYMASHLKLKLHDRFAFVCITRRDSSEGSMMMRDFSVCGIYQTDLEEFDKSYIIGDIKHVVKLNAWKPSDITGFEVLIDRFDEIDMKSDEVYETVNKDLAGDTEPFKVISIKEKYPHIFDWLNLQDMNIRVFLILMLLVAGFNMISGLLILILESTNMIGLLKALGARNYSIRQIFLIESTFLTLKGLLWGNLIGIVLCLIQKYTHFVKLDQASYYISYVPINFNFSHILLLNAGTVMVTVLMLLLPSLIIAKLDPVRSIRYS